MLEAHDTIHIITNTLKEYLSNIDVVYVYEKFKGMNHFADKNIILKKQSLALQKECEV